MPRVRLFGLTIDSDLPLPGPSASGAPDVTVRSRAAQASEQFADYETTVDAARRIDIQHDGIRFLVRGGTRIDVTWPPGCDEGLVVAWLTGVAFGALLLQRGLLPIHANGVRLPGGEGIAAFAGPSGAGKSTLAAQLAGAGYDLFSDDLLGVKVVDGAPVAVRGVPRLRLWQDAIDALGVDPAGLSPIVPDVDKYEIPLMGDDGGEAELPLRRLYLLERADARAPVVIERLAGAAAGRAVLDNSYRFRIATLWHGDEQWAFDRCLAIARHAEVYRFQRPWSLERAHESLDVVTRHLSAP